MKPRFIADVMVGRLARWLRILGFDVAYSNRYDDDEIIRLAIAEDRTILTRDMGIVAAVDSNHVILVQDDDYESQVKQVVRHCQIDRFDLLSRCAECNEPLHAIDKEAVFSRIPPYVYLTHDVYAECRTCHRIYWRGTHAERIAEKLRHWTDQC